MALTAIEIIAVLLAILGLVKIGFILINKKAWYEKVVRTIYNGGILVKFIFVVLAFVIFYFVIQELSIVEIFAVMALTSVLIGLGFMQYPIDIRDLAKRIYNRKLGAWQIIYIFVWIILCLWALYEVFAK